MNFQVEDWLQQGAIIGKVGRWVEVFWGTTQAPSLDSAASVYQNDFFLKKRSPWVQFSYQQRFTWAQWRQLQKGWTLPTLEKLQWQEPLKKDFEVIFRDIKNQIQKGEIIKAVPVVEAKAEKKQSPAALILRGLKQGPKNTYVHGFWNKKEGFLGFTPEVLFIRENKKIIKSMALAGTRRSDAVTADPEDFLKDPKEQKEHQIVVQDILSQLQNFGKTKASKTALLDLEHLVHLYTPLQVQLDGEPTFEDLIRALHPTPALGISPRAKKSLLSAWRSGSTHLGAPFGVKWSETQYLCLVAIRHLRWDENFFYIENGCGVVDESKLDKEWQELKLKRESVKKVFT